MNNTAEWIIREGRIFLQGSGHSFFPSANEIFSAEFRGARLIRNIPVACSPSQAIADIEFSRFMGHPVLSLILPEKGHTEAILEAVAEHAGVIRKLSSIPIDDSIIIDDVWISFDTEEVNDVRSVLEEAGITKLGTVSLGKALALAHRYPEVVHISESKFSGGSLPVNDVSCDRITANLYPYQSAGVAWMASLAIQDAGCILADEMGLGKTLQIITLLASMKNDSPSLVVCPATLMENWRREIGRFAPGTNILMHSGINRTGFPSVLTAHEIVIVSYDTLVRDIALFGTVQWNFVILDEAQSIKNSISQRSKAVRELKRRHSIAVTGTPVENRLCDLWALLEFANPGMPGKRAEFERLFADTPDDARRLEAIVSPLILRRKVAEVANDLPERISASQPVALDDKTAHLYEKLRIEVMRQYGKKGAFAALMIMREFCAHPSLVTPWTELPENFPKLARLLEIAEEIVASGHKCLVFASFEKVIDLIAKLLTEKTGAWTAVIDGRVSPDRRQKIIDEFSETKRPAFLVMNPRAAGTGLNIVAANHVIHYTPEWNPAVEDQATARAYRRGQTLPVTVHRLFVPDTVEEVMNGRVEGKRELAAAAIVGNRGEESDFADIATALFASPLVEKETDDLWDL